MIRYERMSDQFEKWHLGDGRVLHRFSGPDQGGPHDHPWNFTSTVLVGGYVERVYHLDGSRSLVRRRPGDTFVVSANHIHELIALPDGDCWTIVSAGPAYREPCFWNFDGPEPRCRVWNQKDYV